MKKGRPRKQEQELYTKSVHNINAWWKCRKKMIEHYGEIGIDLDKAWFSKLSSTQYDNIIKLTAPNECFRNIIVNNYIYTIEKFLREEGYQVNLRAAK